MLGGSGPESEKFAARLNGPGALLVNRAAIGEFDRRRYGFAERLRAIVAQGDERRFGKTRHQRGHYAGDRNHSLQTGLLGRLQNLAHL